MRLYDRPNCPTTGSGATGYRCESFKESVYSTDISMPIAGAWMPAAETIRIDDAAYLSVHYLSGPTGTNFWAVRWDVTGSPGSYGITTTYVATAVTTTKVFTGSFQGAVYDDASGKAYWWVSDTSSDAVQVEVNLTTAAVTLDESPDLSTWFDFEVARKALVPATYTLAQWCDEVRPTTIAGFMYPDIAICDIDDNVQKTIDITGTPKSEMFNEDGVDAGSEEAFSGSVGSTVVYAMGNAWPKGHEDYAYSGGITFCSSRQSASDTWVHPYTATPAAVITGPPGSSCAGPGGGGFFVQLNGNGQLALYDAATCTEVVTGGIPSAEISYTRAGRLLWITSGGESVLTYQIPEATWDALSIADREFVGYYQSGGARQYIPPVGYTITLAAALEFTMGFYAERMGNSPRLWYISQQNFQWGCLVTNGNALVMSEFYPADVDAADKVIYGSRVNQPTLTYAEALSAVTNANDITVVVPVI